MSFWLKTYIFYRKSEVVLDFKKCCLGFESNQQGGCIESQLYVVKPI